MTESGSILWVTMIAALLILPATGRAQELAEFPDPPTIEAMTERIAAIRADTQISEADRTGRIDLWQRAIDALRLAQEEADQARQYEEGARSAPEELRQIREELAAPPGPAPEIDPRGMSLQEIEASLEGVTSKLTAARKLQSELEAEPGRRAQRRQMIPSESVAIRLELDEIEEQLRGLSPARPEPDPVKVATRAALLSRRVLLLSQLESLNQELQSYEARSELLSARRQARTREVSRLEALQAAWLGAADRERRRVAEEAAEEARSREEGVDPVLQEWAFENTRLAEERSGDGEGIALVRKIASRSAALSESRARLENLRARVLRTKERAPALERAGALGDVLLRERASLPDEGELRRDIRGAETEIVSAQRRLLEIEDRVASERSVDAQVRQILDTLPGDTPAARMETVETQARAILQDRGSLLTDLEQDYNRYLSSLFGHSTVLKELLAEAGLHQEYIDERILWIRNEPPFRMGDLRRGGHVLQEVADTETISDVAGGAMGYARRHLPQTAALLLAVIILAALRWPLRVRLRQEHESASRLRLATIGQTLRAIAYLVLLATPGPLLLMVMAHLTGHSPSLGDAARGALHHAASALFVLLLLRSSVRPGGLAETHLRWPREAMATLHRHGLWLILAVVPLQLLYHLMLGMAWDPRAGVVARLAQCLVMAAFSLFLLIVLRPGGAISQAARQRWLRGALSRWVNIGFLAIILIPLAIIAVSLAGYAYTATRLQEALWATLLVTLALVYLRGIILRWLFLTRRTLILEEMAKREAESEEPAATQDLNISELSLHTRALVRALLGVIHGLCLWWIWADLLPALGILDHVTLWTVTAAADTGEVLRAVTLTDLFLALVIAGMALLGARFAPAALEIALLRRLRLGPGSHYAIITLARYVLIVVGIVWSFSMLGVGWSKVQWLVAAVSVGLGFGLQEIFANLVSGLIILFERPIRLGDWVTIGEVTGKVTRIRVRATTVTDRDRKELVVPNKEFITTRLINWTLTDAEVRVAVPVGIAYGSDTARARDLMLQAAIEHPDVLRQPAPSVLFEAFGDNALQFQLRVFLGSPDRLPEIAGDLHFAIDRLFRESGIVIAFPQRDLHIKGLPVDWRDPDRKEPGSTPP